MQLSDFDASNNLVALFLARADAAGEKPMLWAKRNGSWQPMSCAEAARRAGINVARIRILVFIISGVMAGVGGVILAARLNSVDLNVGGGTLLLDAIAAAVIGGTSLFGGRGEVRSALLGALVITTVSNGLDTAGYKTGTIYIVTGVILLLAVTLDTIARRLQVRSGR